MKRIPSKNLIGGEPIVAIGLEHHHISRATLASRCFVWEYGRVLLLNSLDKASNQEGKLAFFMLTSANVSKAAWGSISKDGSSCMVRI